MLLHEQSAVIAVPYTVGVGGVTVSEHVAVAWLTVKYLVALVPLV